MASTHTVALTVRKTPATHRQGSWALSAPSDGPRGLKVVLPTFMVPKDTRVGDEVRVRRVGRAEGFWRVVGVGRKLRSRHLR